MATAPPPAARGRSAASKPLVAGASKPTASSKPLTASTAASRAKQASNAKSASLDARPARNPSASSTLGKPKATRALAASVDARSRAAPALPKSTSSESVNETKQAPTPALKPAPSAPLPPPIVEDPTPGRTSDPLQLAAQVYPWMYMTSTLEACFQSAEQTAQRDLNARAEALADEEAEIADGKVRLEAQQGVEFYDVLSEDSFAKDAPALMQRFLSHGDACSRIEVEALELASRSSCDPEEEEPLQVYWDMLDELDELQAQASTLEESLVALTSTSPTLDADPTSTQPPPPSDPLDPLNANPTSASAPAAESTAARTQILSVFTACIPVLRARIANLSMAQELVDSAQENLSISLRMESLGLE